jgi:DNA gyrase subunit A
MEFVKAPDFPTGGIIYGTEYLASAYATGRGKVRLRAKVSVEVNKKSGKESLIVSEIPYQVNKSRLIENIANLVRDKVVEGITDLRDESDKDGMRIVIELRKGDEPEVILNLLYKHTQLQDTHSMIMLALVNNMPKVLSLQEMLFHFIEHRVVIVERRTRYDLEQAEARAHILEGLKIAIDNIDMVIRIIRNAADVDVAREKLIKAFKLSEIQANAILAMRLRRLTGLEIEELEAEYLELMEVITTLRAILSSRRNILAVVREETIDVRGDGIHGRGHDRRRRYGRHGLECGLHQAPPSQYLSPTAARRARGGGHGYEGRRFRQGFVHRIDPSIHVVFHEQGTPLLAQGA